MIDEYGQQEFLRRLSDPLWFQAFGCILGFDWHSSGVTTVVTGILNQALKEDVHGISIAGGKGKKSTTTKHDIPKLAEKSLQSVLLLKLMICYMQIEWQQKLTMQQSQMVTLYIIMRSFLTKNGNWAIIQQGMNQVNEMARRYHWISDRDQEFHFRTTFCNHK